MSTKKATSLEQLRLLALRTKSEFDLTNAEIERVSEIGGQPNAIEKILVNGVEQTINEKAVDLAVPTKVSDLTNDSKYQTDTEVAASIQSAIAATGHAHFEKVDTVPTAETAAENVLYLVMNATTNHYDIYALVGDEVVLVDDTTVDLSGYSTTEQMNAAIEAAINALKAGDIATMQAAIEALQNAGATKTEASETNGNIKINGAEVTVYTLPDTVLQDSNVATDSEVTAMLDEVFGTAE